MEENFKITQEILETPDKKLTEEQREWELWKKSTDKRRGLNNADI